MPCKGSIRRSHLQHFPTRKALKLEEIDAKNLVVTTLPSPSKVAMRRIGDLGKSYSQLRLLLMKKQFSKQKKHRGATGKHEGAGDGKRDIKRKTSVNIIAQLDMYSLAQKIQTLLLKPLHFHDGDICERNSGLICPGDRQMAWNKLAYGR